MRGPDSRLVAVSILIAALLLSLACAQAFAQTNKEFIGVPFDLTMEPRLAPILDGSADKDAVVAALVDAGGNWRALADAILYAPEAERADMLWLVTQMPHLDRLEVTADCLLEHLEYARRASTAFKWRVPDDMFREYILAYRLEEEPMTPWRKALFDAFSPLAKDTAEDTARAVNEWVAANANVVPPHILGPRQSPISTYESHEGTETDFAILSCAILKALGIPARIARCALLGEEKGGASWVEVCADGKWLPLYPLDAGSFGDFGKLTAGKPHNLTVVSAKTAFKTVLVTPTYVKCGRIRIACVRKGALDPAFTDFGVSAFNDGAWQPLDDLGSELDNPQAGVHAEGPEPYNYDAVVGPGRYLVTAGVRNENGDAYVQTKTVEIVSGETVYVRFDLDLPVEPEGKESHRKK
jgi:hypothetical protein